jgi:hypothetical protein
MGNQIQASAAEDPPASNASPDSLSPITAPSFNNLIEMLELKSADAALASRWVWLDERGREVQTGALGDSESKYICKRMLFLYFYDLF